MINMKHQPFFTVALLLTACATANIDSSYTLAEKKEEGLVVLSLSHEGIQPGERTVWLYRKMAGTVKDRVLSSDLRDALDWENPEGRLVYFSLPPGYYEFYGAGFVRAGANPTPSWHIGAGGAATANNPWYAGFDSVRYADLDSEPFSIPFEIKAGKATYLGNLHFVWDEAERKGKVVVFDRAERDLPLFQQRLPNIQPSQIRPGQ